MFRSVSEGELAARGALLIENVQDGFLRFEAVTLRGDKLAMQCFLERCLVVNEGASFADFYYSVLAEEEQRGFVAGLSDAEKNVFLQFETETRQVYDPLVAENLVFLAEITARNWLFSTFYFTKQKAVVWGNYGLEYPLFCEEGETLESYKNIAQECGLELF